MKKVNLLLLTMLLVGFASCRDSKKEQEDLDSTLDKIESVEEEVDNTIDEVEQKAKEAESAIMELDSL